MDNIVLASAAGMPAADGKITAGGGRVRANGLFGMLVAREMAAGKPGGPKNEAQACTNPLMALLMGAFLQSAGPAMAALQAETTDGDAGEPKGVPPGLAQVAGLAEGETGSETLAGVLALLQDLAAGRETGESTAGGAFLLELSALLENTGQNGVSLRQWNRLAALLQPDTQTDAAGQDHAAAAHANGAQGAPAALAAIRAMFHERIGQPGQTAAPQGLPEDASAAAPMPDNTAAQGRGPASAAPMPDNTAAQGGEPASAAGMPEAAGHRPVWAMAGKSVPSETTEAGPGAGYTAAPAGQAATKQKQITDTPYGAIGNGNGNSAARTAGAEASGAPSGPPQAVKPGADAFDSIVQSIATLRESTGKEMEIQLKPEFLGRVVIRLTMDGEGLVARIAAANPRVQQALQGQAGELQATLASQGLKDVRVVVTAPPTPETFLQQQADRRGQGQREQHRRGRGGAAGVSDPLETRALLAYEAAYSAGTINYLA